MSVTCESYSAEVREHLKGQCYPCGGDPVLQLEGLPMCLACAVKSIKALAAVIAMQTNDEPKAKRALGEVRAFFGAKAGRRL